MFDGLLEGLICTTPVKSEVAGRNHALEVAAWFSCPIVPRERRSIAQLCDAYGVERVVVADKEPRLYHRDEPNIPLFFHPGMAMQRVLHLMQGEPDRLIQAASVVPGDTVVDATLGAGSDTLVFAQAVGPTGKVISLEVVPTLARLFTWAQHLGFAPYPEVSHLASVIQVFEANHAQFFASLQDDSVDVVYFDPMFQHAIVNPSANMDALRPFTYGESLSHSAMEEAKRVARRCVVMKERPRSGEFARLGLVPDKPRARVAYGVWVKEGPRFHGESGCSTYR